MKDLLIKGKWIKRELVLLTAIFIVAVLLNALGIIIHGTRWIEMLSQLHVVIILSFIIYLLILILRLIIYAVSLPFRRKQED